MGVFNTVILKYKFQFSNNTRLEELNVWLNSLKKFHGPLPKNLKREIYSHFYYYFSHDRIYNVSIPFWRSEELLTFKEEYMNELPMSSKQQILDYIFIDIFYTFKYFFGE